MLTLTLLKEKNLICRVSYKLRRTLPGQNYDYEELYAEDVQSETDEPRSAQAMMKSCIEVCQKNTARNRAKED